MYRIVGWDKHFENNRTRELKKLDWVPIPNKHDGDGYTMLIEHPHGVSHFGVWCLIVQVASKCHPRGTLARDNGEGHDAASLSRMLRVPPQVIGAALARLLDPVGWLEVVPEVVADSGLTSPDRNKSQDDATAPQDDAILPQDDALKGREGKGKKGMESICVETGQPSSTPAVARTASEPAVMEFPCDGNPDAWRLMQSQVDEWQRLFPKLDVAAECRGALAWVLASPERRKTARGMPRFLVGWFGRATNRGVGRQDAERSVLGAMPKIGGSP